MRVTIFDNIKHEEKTTAIETLIKYSTPFQSYFLMVMLSVLMATLGLLMNNTAVIIGSMLIAPVLYPLLGLAMGVVMADSKLIFRSLNTFFKSILLSVIAAAVVTLFVVPGATNFQLTSEILSRTTPTLPDATIAIIAGLAASFALVKPTMSETLPGVAISVALVPPLATIGIGISTLSWTVTSGAVILLLANSLGIVFASVIVFSIMNFYAKKSIAVKAVKKEDKALEKEISGEAKKEIQKEEEKLEEKEKENSKSKK